MRLVELIQEIASSVFEAKKPCMIVYGTVETVEPLTIRLSDNLVIGEEFLMNINGVISADVDETVLIIGGYEVGDKLYLLRNKGGQAYFVLGKVVDK